MNLLPKTSIEFAQKEYWNSFFKKRGAEAFEWYGEYFELCDQINKYVKFKDKVLIVGCGNSKLSSDMYDVGFKDLTNIDVSHVVINQMIQQNKNRTEMKFIQMDATNMNFANDSFSVVLDKGTLDAIMPDDSQEVKETIKKYFNEICRVLKTGGRYLCISLLQEHIINFLLEYFPANGCMFRVVRCYEAEQNAIEKNLERDSMPVFIVVATKFKMLPQSILEICLGGDKMQRINTTNEVFDAVNSLQKAALICNGLNKTNISGNNEVTMDLLRPGHDRPRYTIHILDQTPARGNGKYAAFIVPQGREIEWLFSTQEGRKKLAAEAKYNRLAIVELHAEETFESLDTVKIELSDSIKNLAPRGLKDQIPYLSLGTDVGKRDTIFSGESEISGRFRIEEVEINEKLYRRLIFLQNERIVQSEALIKFVKQKGKDSIKKIDLGHLACNHHLFISVGVQLATRMNQNKSLAEKKIMVIGLGGGGLCAFVHAIFSDIFVEAVEIDSKMLDVAINYFDLKQNDKMKVIIEDGIDYLEQTMRHKNDASYEAIVFDVDSKDSTLGLSCPPKIFLEDKTLDCVQQLIGSNGIFIINLVCRNENARNEIIRNLKIKFTSICSYKLEQDLNEIIYCTNKELSFETWKLDLRNCGNNLNNLSKKCKLSKKDLINVNEFIEGLTID